MKKNKEVLQKQMEKLQKELEEAEQDEKEDLVFPEPPQPELQQVQPIHQKQPNAQQPMTSSQILLEYRILIRRILDLEEQIGKKGRIVEPSKNRPNNQPKTINEVLTELDILRTELADFEANMGSMGLSKTEIETARLDALNGLKTYKFYA